MGRAGQMFPRGFLMMSTSADTREIAGAGAYKKKRVRRMRGWRRRRKRRGAWAQDGR